MVSRHRRSWISARPGAQHSKENSNKYQALIKARNVQSYFERPFKIHCYWRKRSRNVPKTGEITYNKFNRTNIPEAKHLANEPEYIHTASSVPLVCKV